MPLAPVAQLPVLIVGGGLSGGLLALRLRQRQPQLPLMVLEAGPELGGEHTWSCHSSDLTPAAAAWFLPLVSKSWTGYDVHFPGHRRGFQGGYHALRSADFARHVRTVLGPSALVSAPCRSLERHAVTLEDGRRLAAADVVDARGFGSPLPSPCAYQKFYGWFLTTKTPHHLTQPLLMDATVDQLDGYRFVYLLPWSSTELLVEDTYYSDTPDLEPAVLAKRLEQYLRQHRGLDPSAYTVTGSEQGVLPLPLLGAEPPQHQPGIISAGVRAGLYHPTTGYSLAEAVRFADWFAAAPAPAAITSLEAYQRATAVWQRQSFCRRLNNMMFLAAAPEQRRRIMAQFYRRGAAMIGRFYAGELSYSDRLRLLSGRPPVPMVAGFKAFFAASAAG